MSARNSLAIRRINKDIREITRNPVEGIGIASIEDNPMKYVINMRLMNGPYEGYCVQLLLTFSDNYPTKPPKILIYPGQAIDGNYHHHIFQDISMDENGFYFKKFCFDLLDNDFMSTTEEKTGWNPSYSISSLLLQVQNFISDPDMSYIPSKYKINELMNSMNNYSRKFIVQTEQGIVEKVHTWKNPYPEMYFKKENKDENEIKNDIKEEKKKEENEQKMQIIKENLSCFMLKVNYIDDPDILLGYPIIQKKSQFGKNRIEFYPLPEILTYAGFQAQTNMQGFMVDYYFNLHLKSANNEFYNNWIPIYISKEHYEKNKTTILNTFSIIANQNYNMINYPINGLNNNLNQFKPEHIFKVLPRILNSMIIGIFNGKNTLSSSFIRCYFQYILLFKKLCQEFEGEYLEYLNSIFDEIRNNNYEINKKIIPDIGNVFILLLFCNLDTHTESMKKIYYSIYEESLIRQMYWMFHSEETKDNMKKLLLKSTLKELCLRKFEESPTFKMINLEKFNQDLHTKGIFEDIVNMISKDKVFLDHIFIGNEKARQQVVTRMAKSFKKLFNECSKEVKKQLGEIINKNLDFPSYFNSNELDDSGLYDNYNVDEFLKNNNIQNKDEIVKSAFEGQRGNKLLIITFFAQKKIEEEGFMEELEKNYGVYLDVDNFIKDMKQKLKEIKNYKDLYEYIGSEFGRDKDDFELIIESYGKAKKKGYIKTINQIPNSINSSNINSSIYNSGSFLNNSFYSRRNLNRDYRNSRSRDSSFSDISSNNSRNRRRSRSRSRNRYQHNRRY